MFLVCKNRGIISKIKEKKNKIDEKMGWLTGEIRIYKKNQMESLELRSTKYEIKLIAKIMVKMST